MSATEYIVDIRDHHFVLFEQLRVQDIDDPRYAEYGEDLYRMVLEEARKFAEQTLAPLNGPGDRQGCSWTDGAVTTPDGFKAAYDLFSQSGWVSMSLPAEQGGQGLPIPVAMAVVEMFTGAAPAFVMYPGLTTTGCNLLIEMGSDWMKEHLLPKMVTGEWAGTMCLTEPQAGSAVGDASLKAHRNGETYLLHGTKIFVSGGEQDLTDNIIHIMLARTPDAPEGIKGLSLFAVPKINVNEDGSLGDPNDIRCSGIEHKMGLNGSATCTLSIGDGEGAIGWLIGNEGEGMTRMFQMMNEARIGVGIQGASVAAGAYGNAVSYAKDRVQGTAFADFKDAGARRVTIDRHPDVRRMLLYCRSVVDGMRSLGLTVAWLAEQERLLGADSPEGAGFHDLLEVLTPIHKSWCTDECFEVARLAVQVFGGYGYIGEYPVEQAVRDSKVFSIYEGTNGIQALDLVGRKMAMKGGAAFMATMNWLNDKIANLEAQGSFAEEAAGLAKARDRVGACAMHMMQQGMGGTPEMPVLHAHDMLRIFGDVVIGCMLADQALAAAVPLSALAGEANVDLSDPSARTSWMEGNDEAAFYGRKGDNLRFYVHQILPRTAGIKAALTSADRSVFEAVL